MIRTRYFAYFYLLARLLPLMFGGLTQAALNKNPSLMSKSSPATKVGSSLNTTSLSFHPDLTLVQKRLITTITISSTSTDTTDCGCTESTTWLSTATVSPSTLPSTTTAKSTSSENPTITTSTTPVAPATSTVWRNSTETSTRLSTSVVGTTITSTEWETRTVNTTTTETATYLSTVSLTKATTLTAPVTGTFSKTATNTVTDSITTTIPADGTTISIPVTKTISRQETVTITTTIPLDNNSHCSNNENNIRTGDGRFTDEPLPKNTPTAPDTTSGNTDAGLVWETTLEVTSTVLPSLGLPATATTEKPSQNYQFALPVLRILPIPHQRLCLQTTPGGALQVISAIHRSQRSMGTATSKRGLPPIYMYAAPKNASPAAASIRNIGAPSDIR
ncbi:uncharacterized protein ATNIH1004_011678 [Aspergillus tanneri]|uniref:Uncharacterized protein n=1 Tax=Aspergillus tanneri TaxID=1220188 RepID=A0A5M9M3C9_9EURO|nr:uncharacterized protein ATNIH1004_011678 [Aspergillus tanneri]KAA8641542.1 hypothetical protein ATNIH1004_011678 [Aspergillus tanneri]